MPRLPDDLQARAVEHLRSKLHPESIAYLRDFHGRVGSWNGDEVTPEEHRRNEKEYGARIPMPFHFSTGMAIRNVLRGAIKDCELPTVVYEKDGFEAQNWDDYYQAVLDDLIGVVASIQP